MFCLICKTKMLNVPVLSNAIYSRFHTSVYNFTTPKLLSRFDARVKVAF